MAEESQADRDPAAARVTEPTPATPAGREAPSGSAADPAGVPSAPAADPTPVPAGQVLVRRAPRYRAFALTGFLLGVLLGAVPVVSHQVTGPYSRTMVLGYLVVPLGLLGGLCGVGAALLVERRRR